MGLSIPGKGTSLFLYYYRAPQKPRGRPKKRLPASKLSCNFCPNKFKKLNGLYRHINASHKELVQEDWLACEVCR
jgi:hypothetical protein